MLAHVDGSYVRCWSRHGTDLTAAVGDVVSELCQLVPDGTLVDGELVALGRAANGDVGQDFDRIGPTVFGRHHHTLTFVVFDAPRVAGEELAARPWHERRAALEQILTPGGRHVILTETFAPDEAVHRELLRLGFEGSVLKRRDGRYRSGERRRCGARSRHDRDPARGPRRRRTR
jgi:ATP-dependent DNA ligase